MKSTVYVLTFLLLLSTFHKESITIVVETWYLEPDKLVYTKITQPSYFLLGSPWRDKISLAILELQEKGITQILYDKWWKNTGDVCNRDDKSKESKANALGIENIGKLLFHASINTN